MIGTRIVTACITLLGIAERRAEDLPTMDTAFVRLPIKVSSTVHIEFHDRSGVGKRRIALLYVRRKGFVAGAFIERHLPGPTPPKTARRSPSAAACGKGLKVNAIRAAPIPMPKLAM